jgi:hypothetical protein
MKDRAMKKLLTAIATTAAVTLAGIIAAPAARALPTFGQVLGDGASIDEALAMYDNYEVDFSDSEAEALELSALAVANTLGTDEDMFFALLEDPSLLDSLYSGSDAQNDFNTSGFGVFTAQGCSVNADCALKAIGLSLSIQCAGQVGLSGGLYSPEAWASCVQEKDIDAYYAAVACTWGDCPFAALPGQQVVACNKSPNAVIAGKVLLNLPPTLSQGKNDSMQIGLLSQG